MQAVIEARAAADRLPRRRRRCAHFDGAARGARRRRPRLPRQPAPGARPGLLQPHRVRVGHRPASARRARSAAAAATTGCSSSSAASPRRRSAGPWASSACCCCSRSCGVADARRARRTPTRSCPTRQRCRVALRTLRGAARRRRGGADARRRRGGLGSMKSQFKTADASGARYALVFGADELARGEVARQAAARRRRAPQRAAAAGRRSARWAARPAHRIIATGSLRQNPSTMATHLDLEEQEQLDQLKEFWKQYGNLITWAADRRRSAAYRRLERLELVAARPGRQGRRDVRRVRPRRAGRRRRARRRGSSPT